VDRSETGYQVEIRRKALKSEPQERTGLKEDLDVRKSSHPAKGSQTLNGGTSKDQGNSSSTLGQKV
jgi:hypothetical protein